MAYDAVTNITDLSKEQFDKWAPSYDSGVWSKYFQKSTRFVLREISKIDNINSVVDVGSGTGELCINAVGTGITKAAIGVDLSKKMVEMANQKVLDIDSKEIKFVQGQSEKLPLPDDVTDIVTCLNSFHHYDSQMAAIWEAKRILKNNGYYLILDPITDGVFRTAWSLVLKGIFKEPYAKYLASSVRDAMVTSQGFKLYKKISFMYFTECSIYQKC